MLVKLNSSDKRFSGKLDAKTVKKMVDAYRKPTKPKKPINFAHFSVKEVLDLFIDNGIIESYTDGARPRPAEGFGLKIYLGNHVDSTTCPTKYPEYEGHDTTILCNTLIKGDGDFHDILRNDVSILLALPDEEYGLDQTFICPPACPTECIIDPIDPADPNYTGLCINDIGEL